MAFSEEEDSFIVELLNARERHGDGNLHRGWDSKHADSHAFTWTPRDEGATARGDTSAWDGGARFGDDRRGGAGAEAGDVLEDGVQEKQLVQFVSNFREDQGDKLGLLDENDLEFATSQVLRKGPRAGADAVHTHVAGRRRRSRRASSPGAFPLGPSALPPPRMVDRRPLQPREGASPNRQRYAPVGGGGGGGGGGDELGVGSRRMDENHGTRREGGRQSAVTTASDRPGLEADGVETARLCDELLRWSSALKGAERQLGGKGGSGGKRGRVGGHGAGTQHSSPSVPAEVIVEEASEGSTFSRENANAGLLRGHAERSATRPDARSDPGRCSSRPTTRGGGVQQEDRGRSRPQGAAETYGDGRYTRTLSFEDSSDDMEEAVQEWEEIDRGPASSPWRPRGRGGAGRARGGVMSTGHEQPTPSYALPTKHFKTPDRDGRYAPDGEDAHGRKKMQRQAHLEEVNAALRLRMEGQRRAIHELEHQANTLREDAKIREEEFSRLKKRFATSSSAGGGKCSCCASTHNTRARGMGDNGPAALKKRALAAEGRTQTLERCLSESRAKERRTREIVASLKHRYSSAQAKAVSLEAELESTRKTLLEARREVAESRKEAKGRVRDSRKQRRQQGEKEREAEIARAEVANLAVKLRKASRELERARLEAIELREDKARVESESIDLARENRMLQDRLSAENFRGRTRERDRWILAELRSESRSPQRRGPSTSSPPTTRGQPVRSERLPPRDRDSRGRPRGPGARNDPPESTSGFEPSEPRGHSPATAMLGGLHEEKRAETSRERRPSRDGRRANSGEDAPVVWSSRIRRTLSTKSVDGATEDALEDATTLRGTRSPASGSSLPSSSAMGARYERLQAMYQRVNRRDAGNRGRAGVG